MPAFNDPQSDPLRVAVLISGSGSTLANLLDHAAAGKLPNLTFVRVVSSRREVLGVTIAQQANIPLALLRPRDYPDAATFSNALTAQLDADAVDLVVMAGFLCHWRLPQHYQTRTLNIHPALLPRFGGPGMFGHRVHDAVLAAGERESGCTVHLVDEQYDHGPIIAQQRVPVLPSDTPETLADRVQAAERTLYPRVIRAAATFGIEWLTQAAARHARGEQPLADLQFE